MSTVLGLNDPQVSELLLQGKVGVIPTDTIYGFVALAHNKQAVARLYALKNREHKPGTVIAADTEQLVRLGVDKNALEAARQWWPNPLSIVIDASDDASYLHQEVGSLAVRIPSDTALLHLLQQAGPLLTSSANHAGEQPASTLDEAREYFGGQVDFYVDGGDRSGRPPSTVARYQDGTFTVLRQGAVRIDGAEKEHL